MGHVLPYYICLLGLRQEWQPSVQHRDTQIRVILAGLNMGVILAMAVQINSHRFLAGKFSLHELHAAAVCFFFLAFEYLF